MAVYSKEIERLQGIAEKSLTNKSATKESAQSLQMLSELNSQVNIQVIEIPNKSNRNIK